METELRETSKLTELEINSLLELWNKEYPVSLNYTSDGFRNYLIGLKDLTNLLVTSESAIIAWYFDFIREGERWFGMILKRDAQGKGIGSALLSKAKEIRSELNGWVIDRGDYRKADGSPYLSPLGFYEKHDFRVISSQRLELEVFSAVRIQWKSNLI